MLHPGSQSGRPGRRTTVPRTRRCKPQEHHRHRRRGLARRGSHCYIPPGIPRDTRRGTRFDRSRLDPSNPGSRGLPGLRRESESPRDHFLDLRADPASLHRDIRSGIRTVAPVRRRRSFREA
jgi:hypothetical protein